MFWALALCQRETCPFIHNVEKMLGPKRSIKITDYFSCTSTNVIYCTTFAYCKMLYIGGTGRRLGDQFQEVLCQLERNDKDASKPVTRHFNLPNRSKQHMAVCKLSSHLGSLENHKTVGKKFIFQIGIINAHAINRHFPFNWFIIEVWFLMRTQNFFFVPHLWQDEKDIFL